MQISDPKWVSDWAARKVLDKSIWFGSWRGLITEISDEEAETLYSRFSSDVLDQGEQQRVVSVLVSVINPQLAARVFRRACEIRAELSFPHGQDRAKWNLFRQVEDLLKAVSPAMLLGGISEKLDKEPEAKRAGHPNGHVAGYEPHETRRKELAFRGHAGQIAQLFEARCNARCRSRRAASEHEGSPRAITRERGGKGGPGRHSASNQSRLGEV